MPKGIQQFWAKSSNKEKLQLLAREVGLRRFENVVVSGRVVNNELIMPKGRFGQSEPQELPELASWFEEADDRIIPHIYTGL